MAKTKGTASSYAQLRAGKPEAPGIRHERGDPALASPVKPGAEPAKRGGTGRGASNQSGGSLRMPGSKG